MNPKKQLQPKQKSAVKRKRTKAMQSSQSNKMSKYLSAPKPSTSSAASGSANPQLDMMAVDSDSDGKLIRSFAVSVFYKLLSFADYSRISDQKLKKTTFSRISLSYSPDTPSTSTQAYHIAIPTTFEDLSGIFDLSEPC